MIISTWVFSILASEVLLNYVISITNENQQNATITESNQNTDNNVQLLNTSINTSEGEPTSDINYGSRLNISNQTLNNDVGHSDLLKNYVTLRNLTLQTENR